MEVKKGDYVDCFYEGKKYRGLILENPKNDIVTIQIMVSAKRSENPIFETISIGINSIEKLI